MPKEKDSSKKQDQQSIRYEAEEGIPKDKAAEKQRDYAVLEATLNELASPKNPEYKYVTPAHQEGNAVVDPVATLRESDIGAGMPLALRVVGAIVWLKALHAS